MLKVQVKKPIPCGVHLNEMHEGQVGEVIVGTKYIPEGEIIQRRLVGWSTIGGQDRFWKLDHNWTEVPLVRILKPGEVIVLTVTE